MEGRYIVEALSMERTHATMERAHVLMEEGTPKFGGALYIKWAPLYFSRAHANLEEAPF